MVLTRLVFDRVERQYHALREDVRSVSYIIVSSILTLLGEKDVGLTGLLHVDS